MKLTSTLIAASCFLASSVLAVGWQDVAKDIRSFEADFASLNKLICGPSASWNANVHTAAVNLQNKINGANAKAFLSQLSAGSAADSAAVLSALQSGNNTLRSIAVQSGKNSKSYASTGTANAAIKDLQALRDALGKLARSTVFRIKDGLGAINDAYTYQVDRLVVAYSSVTNGPCDSFCTFDIPWQPQNGPEPPLLCAQ